MIFTECTENNEIIFNESKKYPHGPYGEIVSIGNGQYEVYYKGKRISTVDRVEDGREEIDEESKKDNISESIFISTNNGGSYIYDALYESYVQSKIDSEDRLAFALKESMIISEADYSNIRALQEAKLSDTIKVQWKRFIAFIKGLVARFMESISNILLDEKSYLEKYKDIILNRKPKESLEFSYSGNYEVGISRLISTTVPLFEYDKYKDALKSEDDGDLVEKIMPGEFKYVEGETLAEQFKGYFLALDKGQREGSFSKLNMSDIYNFCYNFNKIKGIVDKDLSTLEQSTRTIENAINKELAASGNKAAGDKVENQQTQTVKNSTPDEEKPRATINGKKVDADVVDKNDKHLADSAIISGNNYAISEKVEIKEDRESTDAVSKMGSIDSNDQKEKNAASAGATAADNSSDVSDAAKKWIRVCKPLIGAKLTACQQIANDYMEIIRTHVRSYGGVGKKSKEGKQAAETANTYSKHAEVEKAKANAEKAHAEADKAKKETQ